jgi:hypothetical protein
MKFVYSIALTFLALAQLQHSEALPVDNNVAERKREKIPNQAEPNRHHATIVSDKQAQNLSKVRTKTPVEKSAAEAATNNRKANIFS